MTSETLKQLKDNLEWLSTHNKNYTKQQYYTILDCLELLEKMKGLKNEHSNF